MPIAWYLCPYKPDPENPRRRYCAMDDFTPVIFLDGGDWREVEVLGNYAIVKARAAAATLTSINAATGFTRLPKGALTSPLSDLTNAQKNVLRNKVLSLGYTAQEITARFGNDLGAYTLGDVLRFVATRRIKGRWDANSNSIVFDGDVVPIDVTAIDRLDGFIQ